MGCGGKSAGARPCVASGQTAPAYEHDAWAGATERAAGGRSNWQIRRAAHGGGSSSGAAVRRADGEGVSARGAGHRVLCRAGECVGPAPGIGRAGCGAVAKEGDGSLLATEGGARSGNRGGRFVFNDGGLRGSGAAVGGCDFQQVDTPCTHGGGKIGSIEIVGARPMPGRIGGRGLAVELEGSGGASERAAGGCSIGRGLIERHHRRGRGRASIGIGDGDPVGVGRRCHYGRSGAQIGRPEVLGAAGGLHRDRVLGAGDGCAIGVADRSQDGLPGRQHKIIRTRAAVGVGDGDGVGSGGCHCRLSHCSHESIGPGPGIFAVSISCIELRSGATQHRRPCNDGRLGDAALDLSGKTEFRTSVRSPRPAVRYHPHINRFSKRERLSGLVTGYIAHILVVQHIRAAGRSAEAEAVASGAFRRAGPLQNRLYRDVARLVGRRHQGHTCSAVHHRQKKTTRAGLPTIVRHGIGDGVGTSGQTGRVAQNPKGVGKQNIVARK